MGRIAPPLLAKIGQKTAIALTMLVRPCARQTLRDTDSDIVPKLPVKDSSLVLSVSHHTATLQHAQVQDSRLATAPVASRICTANIQYRVHAPATGAHIIGKWDRNRMAALRVLPH
jgi:hypothetical protein